MFEKRDTVGQCLWRKYPSRRSPGGSLWCQNVVPARGATSGPCSGSQGNYRSVPPLFGFYSGCFHSGFFHKRTSRCPPSVDAELAKSSYHGLPMLFKSRLLQDGHLISNYSLHRAHAHIVLLCVHFIKNLARDTLTSPTRLSLWAGAEQPFKDPLPQVSPFFLQNTESYHWLKLPRPTPLKGSWDTFTIWSKRKQPVKFSRFLKMPGDITLCKEKMKIKYLYLHLWIVFSASYDTNSYLCPLLCGGYVASGVLFEI